MGTLEAALREAFVKAIKQVGLGSFKATSLFMSSSGMTKKATVPPYGSRADLMVQRVETSQGSGVRLVASFEDGAYAFVPGSYLTEALNKTIYDVLTGRISVQSDVHERTRVAFASD